MKCDTNTMMTSSKEEIKVDSSVTKKEEGKTSKGLRKERVDFQYYFEIDTECWERR